MALVILLCRWDSYPEDLVDRPEDWMLLTTFARKTEGLAVRMLIRTDDSFEDDCCSEEEVLEAKRRLGTFAFVGMTDQWEMSVCLFHVIFGGDISASDLLNVRPGAGKVAHSRYDTSMLGTFHDEADEALYAQALQIFERDLRIFGVTEEWCNAMRVGDDGLSPATVRSPPPLQPSPNRPSPPPPNLLPPVPPNPLQLASANPAAITAPPQPSPNRPPPPPPTNPLPVTTDALVATTTTDATSRRGMYIWCGVLFLIAGSVLVCSSLMSKIINVVGDNGHTYGAQALQQAGKGGTQSPNEMFEEYAL